MPWHWPHRNLPKKIAFLPTKHLGVHINSFKRVRAFQIELEFGSVGFWGEGKTGVPGEKPLGARKTTNNKLNPHMASTPGVEPVPHWWEASALNTAPPLLPTLADSSGVSLSLGHTHIGLPYWFHLNFPTSIPATFIWESLPGCIIRFKNFRFRLEFSNLTVHSCSFFERLQNLWYRSTRSCTKIFRFEVILVLKIERKV